MAAAIVRRYRIPPTGAWYAQVDLAGGEVVELKIVSKSKPSDDAFRVLAVQYQGSIEPGREYEVEAEDGTVA